MSAAADKALSPDQRWGRAGAFAGLAFLVLAIALSLYESLAAGACARQSATLLFELASDETIEDLLTGPCGHERAGVLHVINIVDVALFIPLCALFLSLSARVVAGSWRQFLPVLATLVAIAAACADWAETFTQLRITAWTLAHRGWDFEPMRALLDSVRIAAYAKFALLGVNAILLGLICIVRTPHFMRFSGAVLALPVFGLSAAFTQIESRSWILVLAFAIAWLALLRLAFRTWRGKYELPPPPTKQDVPRPWRDGTSANHPPDTSNTPGASS